MLEMLERMIEEHRALAGKIRLAEEGVSDMEVDGSLDKANLGVVNDLSKPLSRRLHEALQAVIAIETGAKKHYELEERELRPVLGTVLFKALKLQHRHLAAEFRSAREILGRCKVGGLNSDERLNEEMLANALIVRIRRQVVEHIEGENVIFRWAKMALEASPDGETVGSSGASI